ncbi:Hsp20 family protein (plasmid) [Skermanella rosea]|uniref:Hsp20 family protein n=1 Tax=Skermanella rosea TaxID=1817965 RepID=UPI001932F2C7|nr:Hsp20 family protein [Skermanella rosea]UEM06856.1 Hsp20 family protein [Skermanella rosea]
MGTIDFSPLFRSTVGFDRLSDMLDDVMRYQPADDYPPYDIEKTGEHSYRVTLAVAGFAPEDITVTAQPNLLLVSGRKPARSDAEYLHRGLALRDFERRFNLADHVEVKGAYMDNGLLSLDLVREVPEAMKPRTIRIDGDPRPKEVEAPKAA